MNYLEHNEFQKKYKTCYNGHPLFDDIGRGTIVYSDGTFVIKESKSSACMMELYIMNFLTKLNFEHMVKCYDYTIEIDRNYVVDDGIPIFIVSIAMEKCDEIHECAHECAHECTHEYEMMYTLLCASKFMYENDVAYGDFKPENVVVDKNGKVKLIDFDCSKICKMSQTKEGNMVKFFDGIAYTQTYRTYKTRRYNNNYSQELFALSRTMYILFSKYTFTNLNSFLNGIYIMTMSTPNEKFNDLMHCMIKQVDDEIIDYDKLLEHPFFVNEKWEHERDERDEHDEHDVPMGDGRGNLTPISTKKYSFIEDLVPEIIYDINRKYGNNGTNGEYGDDVISKMITNLLLNIFNVHCPKIVENYNYCNFDFRIFIDILIQELSLGKSDNSILTKILDGIEWRKEADCKICYETSMVSVPTVPTVPFYLKRVPVEESAVNRDEVIKCYIRNDFRNVFALINIVFKNISEIIPHGKKDYIVGNYIFEGLLKYSLFRFLENKEIDMGTMMSIINGHDKINRKLVVNPKTTIINFDPKIFYIVQEWRRLDFYMLIDYFIHNYKFSTMEITEKFIINLIDEMNRQKINSMNMDNIHIMDLGDEIISINKLIK